MKKVLIFSLFLLAGVLMGTVLTEVASRVSFLSWLCWGDSIGFGWPNPVTLDLSILKVSFGITMELNGAKLLTLLKLCNALECGLADIITDKETREQLSAYAAH